VSSTVADEIDALKTAAVVSARDELLAADSRPAIDVHGAGKEVQLA
jgi:hypothetical protein